jgi:F-type H+-transporting ATPase subunit b
MDETLRKLGELVVGAVPTIILFVVAYASYRYIVHGRLQQVLQERYARSEGAMEKARADIAAAEARTAEYEHRLREAKLTIFKAQEARRQQALQARAAAAAEARAAAGVQVGDARARLEQEVVAAKARLQPQAEHLANEVIRTILKPVAVAHAQHPAGGGQ